MKPEDIGALNKAFKKLKNQKINFGIMEDFDVPENFLVTLAVKKRIPQKPHYVSDGYWEGELVYDEWECPDCGTIYELETDMHRFCPYCGQRIDWDATDNQEEENEVTDAD